MSFSQLIPYILALYLSLPYIHAHPYIYAPPSKHPSIEGQYFLVLLVDARHLDYMDNRALLRTVAKHPSDGSKNGDVGHAWIYLQGMVDGYPVYIEGGHSGEQGAFKPKYFEGVMNYIDYGISDPRLLSDGNSSFEPNPIKYLWEPLDDGFFQQGSGNHQPTYAARIELTHCQFQRIYDFINQYPYDNYALVGNQCSSFVAQVAALAGLDLDCEITIPIQSKVFTGGRWLYLWTDADYAELTIASPDILEQSLKQVVAEKKATNALKWYRKTHRLSWKAKISKMVDAIARFPERYARYLSL
jgi:hypothetical protein